MYWHDKCFLSKEEKLLYTINEIINIIRWKFIL